MYNKKWSDAPMLQERKPLRDSGGNAQQKAESLMKSITMCNFLRFFFFSFLNCGFCETLGCNADAFQELWHSEKGKDWSGGEVGPENMAPFFE